MHVIEQCKILNSSPFCISIDSRSVLRVWDIRTFTTSQVVTLDSFEVPHPLLSILPDDNFLIYSRKLFKVINLNSLSRKNLLETAAPVHIAFNEYHKKFIVATRLDVRLYCSETGRLEEIFVDLIDQGSSIRCFEEGARKRMFYVGDSKGDVRMFNTKNGEKLKTVTNHEEDNEVISRFMRIMHVKEEPSAFKDVTALIYLPDEKILAVGTITSQIKIYNEVDSEESEFSRIFLGGHNESEITKFAYCKETEQLASGSDNGIVCVWNMGSGKLDNIFFEFSSRVVFIAFLHPFPYLLIVQKAGIVSIWVLKQGGVDQSGKCILTLLNFDLEGGNLEKIECGMMIKSRQLLYLKSYYMEVSAPSTEHEIEDCKTILKKIRLDSDQINIENQFSFEQLDKMTDNNGLEVGLKGSKSELKKQNDEYYYVFLGTGQGNIAILELIGFLETRRHHQGRGTFTQAAKAEKARSESIAAQSMVLNHLSHRTRKPTFTNVYPLCRSLIVHLHSGLTNGMPVSLLHPIAASHDSILVGSSDSQVRIFDKGFAELGTLDMLGKEQTKGWGFRFDWHADRKVRVRDVVNVENEIEGSHWSEVLITAKTVDQVKEIERVNAANVGLAIVSTAYSIQKEFNKIMRHQFGAGQEGIIIEKKAYWEYAQEEEEFKEMQKNYKNKDRIDKSLYDLVNKTVNKIKTTTTASQNKKTLLNLTQNDSSMIGKSNSTRVLPLSMTKLKPMPSSVTINPNPNSLLIQNLAKKFKEIEDPYGKFKIPGRRLKNQNESSLRKLTSVPGTQSKFRLSTQRGTIMASRSENMLNRTQGSLLNRSSQELAFKTPAKPQLPRVTEQSLTSLDSDLLNRVTSVLSKAKSRILEQSNLN